MFLCGVIFVKIGMLGFGGMGKVHAYSVENLKFFYKNLPFKAELHGICCAHYENALSAKESYGFARAYETEDELIADPEIDVIDICTPNIYHYETLKKAIAAKKHIYCEKPLCTNAAEACEIARLAKAAGIFGGVVFNTRFLLPVIRARELVSAGKIGTPLSFGAKFLHSSATDPEKKAGW